MEALQASYQSLQDRLWVWEVEEENQQGMNQPQEILGFSLEKYPQLKYL